MFSSVGWREIFVIVVLGVIIVGPERLPGLIEDIRAAIFAARKAINNAKRELNGELDGVSKEFEELRGPITTAAEWGRMGPRAAITKALFDGDESALDDFDPRKVMAQRTQVPQAQQPQQAPQTQQGGFDYSKIYPAPQKEEEPSAEDFPLNDVT